jgi:ubiquitin-protein ligase E3 A
VIHGLTGEQKKQFLMFVTGSDRSPLRGLGQLNFTITGTGLDDTRLPSAHTCFNDMILPRYSSKDILQQKLLQAIENHEGFGLM